MNKNLHEKTIIAFLILVISVASLPKCSANGAEINLFKTITPITVNDEFNIIIKINNVINLWAWKIAVEWDPSAFEYISIEEGTFLKQGSATIFVSRNPDQQNGTVSEIACTRLSTTGVSGTGELGIIKFKAKRDVTNSEIKITNSELKGPELPHTDLEHIINNILITVGSGSGSVPIAKAGNDITVTKGTIITFNGTKSEGSNIIFFWTFIDLVQQNLTGPTPSYKFDRTGIYEITLTIRNNNGASSTDKIKITVIEPTPPTAVIKPTTNFIAKTSIQITFNATESKAANNKEITSYEWDFGDGTKNFEPIVRHSYKEQGNYKIKLTVIDSEGLTTTSEASLIVENNQKTLNELPSTYIILLILILIVVIFNIIQIIRKNEW